MADKLEAYLEEISHYLSGKEEREEILSEIRSHILEKSSNEFGGTTGESLDRAVAAYGSPRKIAERYLDGRPIIAPVYRRYLFRYTALLFAIHTLLIFGAVIFKKNFVLFPLAFIPRLGAVDALMYLPAAFLSDLGIVTLVLYFITRSGKDVKMPWPSFSVDLDEVKPPAKSFWVGRIATAVGVVITLAITDFALHLFGRYGTVFITSLDPADPRPLFAPDAGRRLSLLLIAMLAVSAMTLLVKLFSQSRWVNIASDAVSLALIGFVLAQPFDSLFPADIAGRILPRFRSWAKYTLLVTFLFIALMVAIDLIKNIVLIGRRKLIMKAR